MHCPYCREFDITEEQEEKLQDCKGEICPFCYEYTIPETEDE